MWQVRYIGRQLDDCSMMTQNGFGSLCNDPNKDTISPAGIAIPTYILPATTFHDLTVSFHSSPLHTTLSLGVNNVFNTQDPVVFRSFYGNFDAQQYPVPGRYFYARLTARL
jgi:outer membrane receptor protein involved in Fe transport